MQRSSAAAARASLDCSVAPSAAHPAHWDARPAGEPVVWTLQEQLAVPSASPREAQVSVTWQGETRRPACVLAPEAPGEAEPPVPSLTAPVVAAWRERSD